jgi:hypothetical protein
MFNNGLVILLAIAIPVILLARAANRTRTKNITV